MRLRRAVEETSPSQTMSKKKTKVSKGGNEKRDYVAECEDGERGKSEPYAQVEPREQSAEIRN